MLWLYLGGILLSLSRDKHEQMRLDLSREDLLGSLLIEVDDEGKGVASDELCQGGLSHLSFKVVATLIELLKEGNSRVS